MNFKFPSFVMTAFGFMQYSTKTTAVFLSIDCFVRDMNLTFFADSTYILKVTLTSLVPFILIFFLSLFWFSVRVCLRVPIFWKAVNSVLTLVFFFYPTLTLMVFGLYDCQNVDGTTYLTRDYSITCWEGLHLRWVGILALPMTAIWVIGMPLIGGLLLFKNWNRLKL